MIRAARSADSSVTGLEARTAWWWVKVHGIPVARYVGKGSHGTDSLREELEAENGGVKIPSTVRWLSGAASVKARYKDRTITASSVVFAVSDESTYRSIRRGGLRLQGRRCETEAYEVRPDVGCGRCSGWGHIESKCDRASTRCGWCSEQHEMREHRCPVEGCGVGKGHWCRHTVARCANCKGSHFAQAKVCPKKAARNGAKGWRSPSPRWREPAAAVQPEDPPTTADWEDEGEVEVEDVRHESSSGEEME